MLLVRSAVFLCLEHHRRDGHRDRDQAPGARGHRRPDHGGWSSSIWWRRRRSGAPVTRSTSSSPRRTTRGGWTFTQSPASPSTCCVPEAPTVSMYGARVKTAFPSYNWPRTTSPPVGRRLCWRCWRRSSRPSGLCWVFQT